MLTTVAMWILAALAVATGAYARVTNQRLKLVEHMMQGLMVSNNLHGENLRKVGDRMRVVEAALSSGRR